MAGGAAHRRHSREEVPAEEPSSPFQSLSPNAIHRKRERRSAADGPREVTLPKAPAHREHVDAVGERELLNRRRAIDEDHLVVGKIEEPPAVVPPEADATRVVPRRAEWSCGPVAGEVETGLPPLGDPQRGRNTHGRAEEPFHLDLPPRRAWAQKEDDEQGMARVSGEA